jgi:deoxyribonuclease V
LAPLPVASAQVITQQAANMKYKRLHSWKVTPKEAIQIQRNLARNISRAKKRLGRIEKIAGVDVSYREKKCCAAICVFTCRNFVLLEQKTVVMKTAFPYIPTLLTFREGPVVMRCFRKLKNRPDVVLFDGQGIAHPRRMGLATHIGLWLELPTIGCAKTPLYGAFHMPAGHKGAYSLIQDQGAPIGAVVRTRDNTKPIFVSQGFRITLEDAIRISLALCPKYRIPEPLRTAHTLSKTSLNKYP